MLDVRTIRHAERPTERWGGVTIILVASLLVSVLDYPKALRSLTFLYHFTPWWDFSIFGRFAKHRDFVAKTSPYGAVLCTQGKGERGCRRVL